MSDRVGWALTHTHTNTDTDTKPKHHSTPSPPPGYSDYQLHTFCCMNYNHLGRYCLRPDSLLSSGKLVALDTLLRELKERGSRCAGWWCGLVWFGLGWVVCCGVGCVWRWL